VPLGKLVAPLAALLARLPLARKFQLTAAVAVAPAAALALLLLLRGEALAAALAALAGLCAAYALAALAAQLHAATDALAAAAAQIAGGEGAAPPAPAGDDEFGEIGRTLAAVAADTAMAGVYRQAIVDHAVDGILIIDERDRITTFNPAAERIFGYSAAEIVGSPIDLLIPEPLERQYKLISLGGEVTGRRKDGSHFPMDISSGLLVLHSRRLYVAIVRDVTRRKQVELELQRARDAAEAASRAKSTFLANMSHELRTPLNAIIGYSELLLEEAGEGDRGALSRDLERINRAGRHLLTLINDILDISKIEAGKMELFNERFALGPLLKDVEDAVAPLALANRNRLLVRYGGEPDALYGDQTKLRQVLINLVGNAAKFTSAGTVTLAVHRGPATVRFEVADTGIGIAPEHLSRLFEPFVQADASTTRKYSGTGLGLAITRRYCHMMGGTITVTSELARGSTFTVYLPMELTEEAVGPGGGRG
jgi:PAS domain S-box-containing protein